MVGSSSVCESSSMAAERESRRRGLPIKVRPKALFERFGMSVLGRLRAGARVRTKPSGFDRGWRL